MTALLLYDKYQKDQAHNICYRECPVQKEILNCLFVFMLSALAFLAGCGGGSDNNAPVADAGPDQTVVLGTTVTLDGSGSQDADGGYLNLYWTLISRPTNSAADLSLADESVTLTPDVTGIYDVQLVVNDDLASSTDTVTITVTTPAIGVLDPNFGNNGVVLADSAALGTGFDSGSAITIDSADRILVAGYSVNLAGNEDIVIWRYNADGTPDTNFGSNGVVVHSGAANDNDRGLAIALDSTDRIYVAGYTLNGTDSDMAIWRYSTAGVLDNTFTVLYDGTVAGGTGDDQGLSITLDSADRIYVAGYSRNAAANEDMVIWRYTAAGVLDTSFGTDGVVVHAGAAGGTAAIDVGTSITVDSADRVYVTGYSVNATPDSDMVIWRYTAAGSPDSTFGTGGVVVHHNAALGDGNDYGNALSLDSAGRIYATGYSWNGTDFDMVLWRYTAAGVLDTTFGTGGFAVHGAAAGGTGNDYGNSITLDSANRVYVTGHSSNGTDSDMVLWRYTAAGVLDTTFVATNGFIVQKDTAGAGNDYGNSVALDKIGRVYVTGSSENIAPNSEMVIWRYE